MRRYETLFIDGGWQRPSSEDVITVVSPATEEEIGQAPQAARADVDAAVVAARRALTSSEWAQWAPGRRAEAMERLADALDKRGKETAALVSSENGMPISLSGLIEGVIPSGTLRYYAALARGLQVEETRPSVGVPRGDTVVRHEPVGVVAAIVPWNAPSLLTSFKLAPALAAGCTIVVKPSPETCLDGYLLAEAVHEAGLPAGVVNIVPGDADIGEYLVSHPGIDKVAFTGSTAAGQRVAQVCGRLLRPVTLELGGKSAAIVLDDADLSAMAQALVGTCLLNNGQWCSMSTRILAPHTSYAQVLDLVTDVASSLVVGNPLDPGVHVGPLVSARQRERVESYIASGLSDGATLTTGGGRPSGMDTGWFLDPTVFGDVSNDSRIAREEIFGPVLAVIPYQDLDQAIAIANDSDYGLAGSVFTTDPDRGLQVARRIRTGTIGINGYSPDLGSPYGGVKASGLGRELGPEGLIPYLQPKSIYLP